MTEAVRLMHYDPRWRQEFEQTRSLILHSCQGWVTDVAHVGSTAISGLIARPVVDVVASLEDPLGVDQAVSRLQGISCAVVSSPHWAPEATLLVRPRHGEVTHQIFLTRPGAATYGRLVALCQWLRLHRNEALRFEEAKVECWKASEGNLARYEQAKDELFARLEERIGGGK